MTNKSEQRIERLLDENNGVFIASEAIGSGIPRNAAYDFARERGLEKASPGIFVDADVFPDELYLLQARYPKVVFSHETALYLHDMERTVCDVVRRKAAMDPAAYGYALRRYTASREKDLARLGRYAREMGVERQVQQAMEVLLRSRARAG